MPVPGGFQPRRSALAEYVRSRVHVRSRIASTRQGCHEPVSRENSEERPAAPLRCVPVCHPGRGMSGSCLTRRGPTLYAHPRENPFRRSDQRAYWSQPVSAQRRALRATRKTVEHSAKDLMDALCAYGPYRAERNNHCFEVVAILYGCEVFILYQIWAGYSNRIGTRRWQNDCSKGERQHNNNQQKFVCEHDFWGCAAVLSGMRWKNFRHLCLLYTSVQKAVTSVGIVSV